MPLPVRSLPVIQNWDCHGCTNCCRSYNVRVSDAERAKLDALGWAADPELRGTPPAVLDGAGGYRLSQLADGTCVFLGPDNRCRIHAKYGATAKPAACRIFPFTFSPAGDHWRAGVRFACPTVVKNIGKPLPSHAADVKEYASLLEADAPGRVRDLPPTPLGPNQNVSWSELLRFVEAIERRFADETMPVERRVRQVAALVTVWKAASYEKVHGSRLGEFLDVMAAAVGDEVPADPIGVPPPTHLGRVLFRQTAAVYARQDNGPEAGIGRRGRLARFGAAWRFAVGTGRVPRLHGLIPDGVTFAEAERPAGPLPSDAEALLGRYYRVKVDSLQFAGQTNFGTAFWDGLSGLLLTFPVILWLARVLQSGRGPLTVETVGTAVRIVDDGFGFNPLLGTPRQVRATRLLADRGELARLAAWYAR